MFKKLSTKEKIYQIVIVIIMLVLIIGILYPFWFILTGSLSEPSALAENNGPRLFSQGFSFNSYKLLFSYKLFSITYLNTIFYVVVGTLVNVIMTVFAAFVLTRKGLKGRKLFIIITALGMFINAGFIPSFLVVKEIGLLNSRWALIIPGAISAYCLVILYIAFRAVPQSLEEAARIDGTNYFHVLRHVVLPMSMPFVAAILLYYSLGHWNSYFMASRYIQDIEKFPLQVVMRNLVSQIELVEPDEDYYEAQARSIKYAAIIVTILPLFIIYPLFQKYFVKGVLIGSLKG